MKVKTILALSPYLEVLVRHIYWNSSFLIRLKKKLPNRKVKRPVSKIPLDRVINHLRAMGIGEGDLLIVHSSYDSLKVTGASPCEIVDALKALVGLQGTLAFPAFPIFKNEPEGRAFIYQDISGIQFEYDVRRTLAWTGIIPNGLIRRPDAIRSAYPLNSMIALGPLAKEMMRDNIKEPKPYACGKNSSWAFCYNRNAKILALGVDMAHSITMIHVVEDLEPDMWPIKNWYRQRNCIVKDGETRRELTVMERDPKWLLHFAERTLAKDMINEGVLKCSSLPGLPIALAESSLVVEFLRKKNKKNPGYPYFLTSWRRGKAKAALFQVKNS